MPEPITVKVRINGTDTNRWHAMGLRANPFPQTAKAEHAALDWVLRQLDGDPIPNAQELENRLAHIKERTGAHGEPWEEFCVAIRANYRTDEVTEFDLTIGGN